MKVLFSVMLGRLRATRDLPCLRRSGPDRRSRAGGIDRYVLLDDERAAGARCAGHIGEFGSHVTKRDPFVAGLDAHVAEVHSLDAGFRQTLDNALARRSGRCEVVNRDVVDEGCRFSERPRRIVWRLGRPTRGRIIGINAERQRNISHPNPA